LEYATILSAPIRAYCSSSTVPATEVLRHPTRVIVAQAATVAYGFVGHLLRKLARRREHEHRG